MASHVGSGVHQSGEENPQVPTQQKRVANGPKGISPLAETGSGPMSFVACSLSGETLGLVISYNLLS